MARHIVALASVVALAAWSGIARADGGVLTEAAAASGASASVDLKASLEQRDFVARPASPLLVPIGAGIGGPETGAFDATVTSPSAAGRLVLLTQGEGPADVALTLRAYTIGFEGKSSEAMARAVVARSFGPLRLAAGAGVGRGFGGRDEVDVEVTSRATLAVGAVADVGVEARARTEAQDLDEPGDGGNAIEVVSGPSASVHVGAIELKSLAGWSSPRGTAPSGAAGFATASFAF